MTNLKNRKYKTSLILFLYFLFYKIKNNVLIEPLIPAPELIESDQ